MSRLYYDLHIHSCLSPCGDNDSTPDSIAGMGELNGLNIMALTDHNTAGNCPAFFKAARRHGIIPIAGMELTTAEDIHVVCLFPELQNALDFETEVRKSRACIKNRADIFGEQRILDENDNIIGYEENLLINATGISVESVLPLTEKFGGVSFPAHIDKQSNSVLAVLGVFPKDIGFKAAEIHNAAKREELSRETGIPPQKFLVNSDAHYLWDIKERTDYLDIPEQPDESGIRRAFLARLTE